MASETDEKASTAAAKDQETPNTQTSACEKTGDSPAPALDASTIKSLAPKAEEQSKKKRRSNIQLNKDDHPEGECSDEDGELNDEGEKRSDPFKRASEDVLKARKIVKVSKKWEKSESSTGGGVFGSVQLVAPEKKDDGKKEAPALSVFGSSAKVPTFGSAATFGSGFGAVSNGFGALKPKTDAEDKKDDNSKPTFGSGFASTGFGGAVKSNGFGNVDKKTDKEDTATKPDSEGTFTASTSTTEKIIMKPTEVNNGEQNEDLVCEVRAKVYKLSPVDDAEEAKGEQGENVPSVPSTSGRMELKKNDEKKEENEQRNGDKIEMEWKSRGIGPVRVLQPKMLGTAGGANGKPRVVQRHETAAGSKGTTVILNTALVPECKVTRTSDKTVKLDAPNPKREETGRALESFSFKVKTEAEADLLMSSLKKMLES
jgi:Pyruvate/2-oxoacid:ferredoxin oxidoreductase gamma subunit